MSDRIKIAIFGVGRWGVHLLRNFLQHPQAQVVAVVDPQFEKLAAIAERFQLDDRVFLTTQWQDALELQGLEAVVIATPAITHYPLITAALKQGLHILAEKPLTLDATEALQLCQLAEQQQRHLVVDHTYLFHSAVQQGRSLLQTGKFGKLRYGYATRTHLCPIRSDVDVLWDLAIHDLAILHHWLGELPRIVEARGRNWLEQNLADVVWATLVYSSGFEATIHGSWLNSDKQRRLCVVGEQGSLIFDELAVNPLMMQLGQIDRAFQPINQQCQAIKLPATEPLSQVCDHFLQCIQSDQPSEISSGWLGAEFVRVLAALSLSMQRGCAIAI
jgi:predicted dehydrogenase